MTGSVVVSEVDAIIYVVISKDEQHMPYGELVCTTERLTLHMRCCTNRGYYNHVQL
jgi:hypothetical protein